MPGRRKEEEEGRMKVRQGYQGYGETGSRGSNQEELNRKRLNG